MMTAHTRTNTSTRVLNMHPQMKARSAFDVSIDPADYPKEHVEAALKLFATAPFVQPGVRLARNGLLLYGLNTHVPCDTLDAVIDFLAAHSVLVKCGHERWLVRRRLTEDDVTLALGMIYGEGEAAR